MYIHLNNDLTPRNDNKGGCVEDIAYAVPDGAKVTAGQQIAWNGDSGDASGNPHLHFEVHPNDGGDVNPFRHLKRATKPLFARAQGRRLQPRPPRDRSSRREPERRRSRSIASGSTRAAAGSRSMRARSS